MQEAIGVVLFIAVLGFIGYKVFRKKYPNVNPMLEILENIEKNKK